MATLSGAAALGLKGRLGRLAPGYLADIALLDVTGPLWTPCNDAFAHLAYCETGQSVVSVVVDGRLVMDRGRMKTIDEASLLAAARQRFRRRQGQEGGVPQEEVEAAAAGYRALRQAVLEPAGRGI